MAERIVITGTATVGSLGCSVSGALERMAEAPAAAEADVNGRAVPWAPVADYDPCDYVPRKKVRRMDPANTYAIAVARMALEQAGVLEHDTLRANCGVLVGTGYSGFASVVAHQKAYLRDGIEQLTPIHFPNTVYNASAGLVAIELGLNGPNSTITGLDLSGEYALVYGWMLLRQGMTERVVVVGVDDLCPALLEGLHDLGFAVRDRDGLSAPFASRRHGFLPSEGAGAVVLESAAAAHRRGAAVLGEIEGVGTFAGADTHYDYSPSGEAVRRSVQAALLASGRGLSDVDWVSSAANASRGLDRCEAAAWPGLLDGDRHAVVPFKAFTGEFSAAGVQRLVLGLASTARGSLPAVPRSEPLDGMAALLPESPRPAGRRFLHQGTGLGANCVSLLVSGPTGEIRHAH